MGERDWKVQQHGHGIAGELFSVMGPYGHGIALNMNRDDANLIAAAPDLYDACSEVYLSLLTSSPEPWRTFNQSVLAALRDAIAKAEGIDGEEVQDRFEAKAHGQS